MRDDDDEDTAQCRRKLKLNTELQTATYVKGHAALLSDREKLRELIAQPYGFLLA